VGQQRIRSHPFIGDNDAECKQCGAPFSRHVKDEPTHAPFPDTDGGDRRECGFRNRAGVQCARGVQLTRGVAAFPYWSHRPGRKRVR
jgi:hypothetical protein